MRLSKLLEAAGMQFSGRNIQINGISADWQNIGDGFLFAAHKHKPDLVNNALKKGAAAALLPSKSGRREKAKEWEKAAATGLLTIATEADNPPQSTLWSDICAAWWGNKQPSFVAAVTGTNAKSSVVAFAEQIWRHCRVDAASLGTLGLSRNGRPSPRALTTQEPFALHRDLAALADARINHLAMEASSHALAQHRLDAVRLRVGVFTNLTAEHLDYHKNLDDYFAAKQRLFSELLPSGATAIIGSDYPYGRKLATAAAKRGLKVVEVGKNAADFKILAIKTSYEGTTCRFAYGGGEYSFSNGLVGDFQALNALFALALVVDGDCDFNEALRALNSLKPPNGRMEPISERIFLDYAHTADALKNALTQLKGITRGRLLVVFGAGGDRDRQKRPKMGEVAASLADIAIITDDNPRNESAAAIRKQIISGAVGGSAEIIEIADRNDAIAEAVGIMGEDDALLVAGKGHEGEQIVGDKRLPFSDKRAVELATPLWSSDNTEFLGDSSREWRACGVSIDSRTVKPGELFVALPSAHSPTRDGVRFLADAATKGAAAAVTPRSQTPKKTPLPIVAVADSRIALTHLAERAVARTKATVIAVTGSVGKTDTKEFLSNILGRVGKTQASKGNHNNQLGLPLTLANLKADTEFAVVEAAMNHPGELTYLSTLARPKAVVITNIGDVHRQFFASTEEIAEAKAEIFYGLRKNGTAVLPIDDKFYPYLKEQAERVGARVITFGKSAKAQARLLGYQGGIAEATINGQPCRFSPPVGGEHHALNALAALAMAATFGKPEELADAVATTLPLGGRGERRTIGNFTFIDESYNAAPPSMRACLAELAARSGNKLAVLGDMLELGPTSANAHRELAAAVAKIGLEKVFLVGEEMRNLQNALPKHVAAVHSPDVGGIIPPLKEFFGKNRDYLVLVKGSRAIATEKVIAAFAETSAKTPADGTSMANKGGGDAL